MSQAGKAYKSAKSQLEKLEKPIKEKIENLNREGEKIENKLLSKKNSAEDIKKMISPIQLKLDKRKQQFKEKNAELDSKEAELKEMEPATPPVKRAVRRETETISRPSFPLFDTAKYTTSQEKALLRGVQSKLGLTPNKKAYADFHLKLAFGFSIGQKTSIAELAKIDESFTVENLEDMLEGGNGMTNMFYVAHFLEQHIPQAERDNADPEYIKNLKSLQTTLMRSLSFAVRKTAIENRVAPLDRRRPEDINSPAINQSLNSLSTEIRQELELMKPGEKFFLPVGTGEHETLLVFEKKENRKIGTTLYNTGDGVEHNITGGFKKKAVTDLFSAAFKDKFPITRTFDDIDISEKGDTMQDVIKDALKNRMLNGSMADLNDHLYRLGKSKTGKPKEVQISGVCSFQVLTEAFQDMMPKESYLRYNHAFLTSVQEKFEDSSKVRRTSEDKQKVVDALSGTISEAIKAEKTLLEAQLTPKAI